MPYDGEGSEGSTLIKLAKSAFEVLSQPVGFKRMFLCSSSVRIALLLVSDRSKVTVTPLCCIGSAPRIVSMLISFAGLLIAWIMLSAIPCNGLGTLFSSITILCACGFLLPASRSWGAVLENNSSSMSIFFNVNK